MHADPYSAAWPSTAERLRYMGDAIHPQVVRQRRHYATPGAIALAIAGRIPHSLRLNKPESSSKGMRILKLAAVSPETTASNKRPKPAVSLLTIMLAACGDPAGSPWSVAMQRLEDATDGEESDTGEDLPLRHLLQGRELPGGLVPVLEVLNAPNGKRYALQGAAFALEDGDDHGEGGYFELDVYPLQPVASDDADFVSPPDAPVPLVDPRIIAEFDKGRETVSVSVWLHDEPHRPLFLELQRQVLRGDVRTVGERRTLHSRLIAERRSQVAAIQVPLLKALADNDIPVVYRCSSAPCVYTTLPRQKLMVLQATANLAGITLEESTVEPEAPFGAIIGEASQLQFYVDANYVGEGPTTSTSDDIVATILEVGESVRFFRVI